MGTSLEKRLAKVEQELAEIRQRFEAQDCICAKITRVFSEEQLKAEKDTKCPVHGARRDHFVLDLAPEWQNSPPIKEGRYPVSRKPRIEFEIICVPSKTPVVKD